MKKNRFLIITLVFAVGLLGLLLVQHASAGETFGYTSTGGSVSSI